MLFPLAAISILTCLLSTWSRDTNRSPMALALLFWGLSVVLVAVPLLSYDVAYSLRVDALVAGSLLAATTGYLLVRVRRPARSTGVLVVPIRSYRHKERTVYLVFAALGVVGGVMLLIDVQNSGTTLSLSYLVTNLTSIRSTAIDSSQPVRSLLFNIGLYLLSCSYVAVIAATILRRSEGALFRVVSIASLVMIAAVSLFAFGGRTIIVNAVLLLLAAAYLRGGRVRVFKARTVVGITLLALTTWYLATSYFSTREGDVSVDYYLSHLERAKLRPWIGSAARNNAGVGSAVINFGYFASPLATLSWYDQQRERPGPFWGQYSYPLATRVLSETRGTQSWIAVRREVFAPLESAGYAGNVWGTWLRDLVVDFGYLGTLVYCFAFAGFMGWARNGFERTGAVHYHVLEVLACVTLAFGAFQGLLPANVFSGTFLAAIGAMLVVRLQLQQRQARPYDENLQNEAAGAAGRDLRP